MTELRVVTCHMGSHDVRLLQCHQHKRNASRMAVVGPTYHASRVDRRSKADTEREIGLVAATSLIEQEVVTRDSASEGSWMYQ